MASHADSNEGRREAIDRRLAAIAVVDIVDYTRLMECNETQTHALWKSMASGLISEEVRRHRGRIVKSTGDGFLLEFTSIADAVIWAFDVQEALARQESEQPQQVIRLRIAVHFGDIIHEPEDIFGSGVNIVARLQEIAEPGGIVISGMVHDQVQPVIRYEARNLGRVHLKNIDRPMQAYAVRRRIAHSMEAVRVARTRTSRPLHHSGHHIDQGSPDARSTSQAHRTSARCTSGRIARPCIDARGGRSNRWGVGQFTPGAIQEAHSEFARSLRAGL